MVEIDEGVFVPDSSAQGLAGHDLSRVLQQRNQNLERLLLQTNAGALLAQFSSLEIYLKDAES